MAILVTGATDRVGRQVVHQLANRSAGVRTLVRNPPRTDLPASVNVTQGDMLDTESLRRAFVGIRTLFLLNVVAGDEFTQILFVLNVTRGLGVERVVYLSVVYVERFINVSYFAMKPGVERMIEWMGFSATILCLAYFMNNEHMVKNVIVDHGVYLMPIGSKGVTMVDTRDIVKVVTIELIHRDAAPDKLPIETVDLVDPDMLTGPELVSTWSGALGRLVACGGDDPSGFETNLANSLSKQMAHETRLMVERYVSDNMVPQTGDIERLTRILGRPLGTYHGLAAVFAQ